MSFHQLPAEIQAQPRSANSRGSDIVGADKSLKDVNLLLTRNPHAAIANTEAGLVRLSVFLDRHLDRASLWTVLDRIGQQIGKDLFDTKGIHRCLELGQSCVYR